MIRPATPEDFSGLVYLWIETLWRQRAWPSSKEGKEEAKRRHWDERKPTVEWLLREPETWIRVLCDPAKEDIIWGFSAINRPIEGANPERGAIHMVMVKDRFKEVPEERKAMFDDLLAGTDGFVMSEGGAVFVLERAR